MEDLRLDSSSLNISVSFHTWLYSGIQYLYSTSVTSISKQGTTSEDLPYPWNEFYLKASLNSRIIITYFHLAQDFESSPDLHRKHFLRNFIIKLGLPKGSISFWPFTTFKNNINHLHIDTFIHTLNFFKPARIICFGDEYKDTFASFFKTPMVDNAAAYDLFIFLPSIEKLLNIPPSELNEILYKIM